MKNRNTLWILLWNFLDGNPDLRVKITSRIDSPISTSAKHNPLPLLIQFILKLQITSKQNFSICQTINFHISMATKYRAYLLTYHFQYNLHNTKQIRQIRQAIDQNIEVSQYTDSGTNPNVWLLNICFNVKNHVCWILAWFNHVKNHIVKSKKI